VEERIQVTQLALDFTAYPRNAFGFGTQNYRVYELLTYGPVTGLDINKLGILSHTRRISDLREYLHPLGWTVKSEMIRHRPVIYEYRIERL
jgi:hypothetical protein